VLAIASALYLVVMILIGFARQRGRFTQLLAKRLTMGGGLTLGLLILFGAVAAIGFDSLFIKFHELSFANDFWQLDPRTDYLVRIFPENFWFDATLWVAIRAIIGALLILVAGSSYLVYQRYESWQEVMNSLKGARVA
jgi:integral membrane protein (TIGR01906 family)